MPNSCGRAETPGLVTRMTAMGITAMTINAGIVEPTSRLAFQPADLRSIAPPRGEDAADLSATLAAVLDTLDDGLIVTTERGLVVHANRAAQAMVATGALSVWNGQLCAAAATDTRTLRTAIAACARDGKASLLRLAGLDPHQSLTVTLNRTEGAVVSSPGRSGPLVVAALRDGTPVRLPEPLLQALFGLTLAEARLAAEVMRGDGLQACAQRLGIAANTARTHLHRVFDKTGTKRQAELVRLLLGCRCS